MLDVELAARDEITAGEATVRAQVVASVRDGDAALWEQTITIDRPIAATAEDDRPRAVVDAMADALEAAIATVDERATVLAK